MSKASSVSTVIVLRAGRSGFSSRQGHWRDLFSLRYRIWGPPISRRMDTEEVYLGDKAAGAWNWPLPRLECVKLFPHFPTRFHAVLLNQVQDTSPWRVNMVKRSGSCTCTFSGHMQRQVTLMRHAPRVPSSETVEAAGF